MGGAERFAHQVGNVGFVAPLGLGGLDKPEWLPTQARPKGGARVKSRAVQKLLATYSVHIARFPRENPKTAAELRLARWLTPSKPSNNLSTRVALDEAAVAREYRAAMAEALADPEGVFVVDDTTFPKAGQHSVGVQRQHCGALGKKANCQCAVSLHYVAPKGHGPLSMRLFLPPAWLA